MSVKIEPYSGGGLEPKKWVRRNYPFKDLLPGDSLFVTDSIAYFRAEASRYYKKTPAQSYQTRTVTRDGLKGVLLTRTR